MERNKLLHLGGRGRNTLLYLDASEGRFDFSKEVRNSIYKAIGEEKLIENNGIDNKGKWKERSIQFKINYTALSHKG